MFFLRDALFADKGVFSFLYYYLCLDLQKLAIFLILHLLCIFVLFGVGKVY